MCAPAIDTGLSDQRFAYCTSEYETPIQKPRLIWKRKWNRQLMEHFAAEIETCLRLFCLLEPQGNSSLLLHEMTRCIQSALDKFFPFKKSNKAGRDLPWISSDIWRRMKVRDCYNCFYKCFPSGSTVKLQYQQQRSFVERKIHHEKHKYLSECNLSTAEEWTKTKYDTAESDEDPLIFSV